MRYRIVFRLEYAGGETVMPERAVTFEPGDNLYARLTDALLVMAKLIKSVLTDAATPRP